MNLVKIAILVELDPRVGKGHHHDVSKIVDVGFTDRRLQKRFELSRLLKERANWQMISKVGQEMFVFHHNLLLKNVYWELTKRRFSHFFDFARINYSLVFSSFLDD